MKSGVQDHQEAFIHQNGGDGIDDVAEVGKKHYVDCGGVDKDGGSGCDDGPNLLLDVAIFSHLLKKYVGKEIPKIDP